MALTTELLKGNAATAGLTDEQINAITEMSRNDETTVIGQKTGEIYGGLDADILAASGIAKNGTEKTYDYAKRVIGEIKSKAGDVQEKQNQIDTLTREKARLEKVIADGGADAETKKQLKQAQTDLAAVTKNYTDLKSEFDTAKENHAKELFGIQLDGEFAKATAGIKFKADIPQTVKDIVLKQSIEKVKGMFPEYIDDGNGGKVLAFKDGEQGAVLRNRENNLNPYTAKELVMRELKTMGVLETGRKQLGTGTEDQDDHRDDQSIVDVTAAKTQLEASEIIARSLMAQGLTIGSKEYDDAYSKAWKDNNIKSLPMR